MSKLTQRPGKVEKYELERLRRENERLTLLVNAAQNILGNHPLWIAALRQVYPIIDTTGTEIERKREKDGKLD